MEQDGIKRVTICFPKDDSSTLITLDQVRGNQSRSEAIQRCLEYLCQTPESLKGIISTRHKQEHSIYPDKSPE